MSAGDVKHDYHLVNPSPWPLVGSAAATIMAMGGTSSQLPVTSETPEVTGVTPASCSLTTTVHGPGKGNSTPTAKRLGLINTRMVFQLSRFAPFSNRNPMVCWGVEKNRRFLRISSGSFIRKAGCCRRKWIIPW